VLLCLLSRCLVSLEVTFTHIEELHNEDTVFPQSSDYARLAEEIISTSPDLADLDLFCSYLVDDPSIFPFLGDEIFSSLLESQPTIRRLGMTLGIFQQLLRNPFPSMPQLTELDLRGVDFNFAFGTTVVLQLPALRKLSGNIPWSSKELWIPLISAAGTTIEEIGFNVNDNADEYANLDPLEVVDVITVIGTSCPSLKSLRICGNLTRDVAFSPGFLRPILNCTKITDLCIEPSMQTSISHYTSATTMSNPWHWLGPILKFYFSGKNTHLGCAWPTLHRHFLPQLFKRYARSVRDFVQ
jgi:hypothetical protein